MSLKILVGHTAGVESTAALVHGIEQGHDMMSLHIEYGPLSRQETPYVKKMCEVLGVKCIVYKFEFEGDEVEEPVKDLVDAAQYIPIAGVIASRWEPDQMWGGMNIDDHIDANGYGQAVVDMILQLRWIAAKKRGPVQLVSPLARLTKQQQYDMIPDEVKKYLAYCHVDRDNPCGKCIKCEHYNQLEGFAHRKESVI